MQIKNSIKRKLIIMNTITSLTVIAFACLIFILFTIYQSRISLIKELTMIVDITGKRIAPALYWADEELTEKSLDPLVAKESILNACLYNKNDEQIKVLYKYSTYTCPDKYSNFKEFANWSIVSIGREINFAADKAGYLILISDLRDVKQQIPKYLGFGMSIFILSLFVAAIISARYQKKIATPISLLSNVTEDVIERHDYSLRSEVETDDEIGYLSNNFNKMMEIIEQRDQDLNDANDNLEQKVLDRTRELEIAKEKAESSNKAKSEFLRNMSHEFRTPLHAMSSFSKYGIKEAQTAERDELHKYFTRIAGGTARLLKLVEGLLSLAKLESGQEMFSLENSDLFAAVDSVLLEEQSLLNDKQIEAVLNKPSDDIKTIAVFDNAKIIQVITNIISNAIKFTPNGKKIIIDFANTTLPDPENLTQTIPALQLAVSDQGIGIPENELEKIFDKFVQSSRTNTGTGGTGLGLPIAKNIIVGHNGTIKATINKFGGSTFTICLPYNLAPGKKIISFTEETSNLS